MSKISTILLVDDNEIDHVTAKYAIQDYDAAIKVSSAYDGQEALDMIRSANQKFDVIFLDINMPGMNGHDFLAEYHKDSEQASVIVMLTSSCQQEDKDKCSIYSFVKDYQCKPLETEALAKIEAFL